MPHYFFRKNEAPHYPFIQNEVSWYFFRKKSAFVSQEIRRNFTFFEYMLRHLGELPQWYCQRYLCSKKMKCLIISSEFLSKVIVKHFVFFWRNNEALGHVTSIIILLMLFLQWKNPVRHYFFRKMMRHLIISSKKMKCFIIF